MLWVRGLGTDTGKRWVRDSGTLLWNWDPVDWNSPVEALWEKQQQHPTER